MNDTPRWRSAKSEIREALRRIGRGREPATAVHYERLCDHLCQYVVDRCGGQIGEDEASTIVMECLLLTLPPLYLSHRVHYEVNPDSLFSMLADRILERFLPSLSADDRWPITPTAAARTDLEIIQHIFGAETTIEHYQSAIDTLRAEERDFQCLIITQFVDMATSGVIPTMNEVIKKLLRDRLVETEGTWRELEARGREAWETFIEILQAQQAQDESATESK